MGEGERVEYEDSSFNEKESSQEEKGGKSKREKIQLSNIRRKENNEIFNESKNQ